MADYETISYETFDGYAVITLNRPEAMNALNLKLLDELPQAVLEFENDDSLFAAILTGAGGRAFSAGGDLKEAAGYMGTGKDPRLMDAPRQFKPTISVIADCRKPIIAAIDGHCLAGGLEVALGADFRFATRKSQFGIPEVKRSLIAGPGTIMLPRLIPKSEALYLAITGETIDADRAYQLGLIQGVFEDREALFAHVERIAGIIASNPPLAVEWNKTVVRVGAEMTIEHAYALRAKYFDAIIQTEDGAEGSKAFAEKRKPVWKRR